jgi:molecular chaperone GrpE
MTTDQPLPEDAAGEPTAAELNPEIKIAELEGRLAEMSDAYLRAKAEAENVRRRAEEDIS